MKRNKHRMDQLLRTLHAAESVWVDMAMEKCGLANSTYAALLLLRDLNYVEFSEIADKAGTYAARVRLTNAGHDAAEELPPER